MPRDPHDAHDAAAETRLAGALHDVSNALTLLLGWVAEARDAAGTAERDHALAMIDRRARVARDLARQAIGAAPAADADGALQEVVDEIEGSLAAMASRAGARIVRAADSDALASRLVSAADATQVLTNLVMNALAWSPRGSTVTLEASVKDDAALVIQVQDVGPGVEPSRAEAVFQGDTTRTGGAGVGLRHARAVARRAGGDLELVPPSAPDHPGKGARFRLTWPRAGIVAAGPLSNANLRASVLAGKRVLIVEDDAEVAALLEAALGARGAEITIAKSARELAAATRSSHDAALVDLSPIESDVDGAIGMIRATSPNVHVVFISGTAVGLPDSLSEASVRWVRKPFEVSEIVSALVDKRPATG